MFLLNSNDESKKTNMTHHFFQGEQPRPDHQRGAGLPPDDEHHLRAAVDRRPADSRAGHRLRFTG